MRLDKFLALNGFGSRKDVKKIVKDHQVMVNGDIIKKPAVHINPKTDEVHVYGDLINFDEDVYYMLNKPSGYISSHDRHQYPSVLDLIDSFRNDLIIVGRLDVDTEGLLLISNDGQFSHQISHGKKNVPKKYYVELEKPFDKSFIDDLERGVELDDFKTKPANVKLLSDKSLELTISEGKYHQVKRMMHHCNNEVVYLKRIEIGDLPLDPNLNLGDYRPLTKDELNLLDYQLENDPS